MDGLNITTIATKAVAEEIRVATTSTERTVQDLAARHISHQQHQERQTFAQWLTPIDHTAKHQDVNADRQAGTGQNLLESVEFQTWCDAANQTLVCPGIPGAGKTVLTAIVIESLQNKYQTDDNIRLGYIYFNYETPSKSGDIYSSILKQILLYHCRDLDGIMKWCSSFHERGSRPSSSEMKQFLSVQT